MKYKENVWYGWNGGECPVHPESVVEVQIHDERFKGYTRAWEWTHHNNGEGDDIIAFRVIKEYKPAREWWAVGKHLHDTMAEAEKFCDDLERDNPGCGYGNKGRIIHVREVQE